jgi:hypothetical protein
MELCDRQLHRAVLRNLSSDIDAAYLVVARAAIQNHVQAGRLSEARDAAAETLGLLVRPESGLIDLAGVHLASAARLAPDAPAVDSPPLSLGVAWISRLNSAITASSDLERARKLAELAIAVDEPSRRAAEAILLKAKSLVDQAKTIAALAESGRLLRSGDCESALLALDAAGESSKTEPRVLRQKGLLLLKFERFDEADGIASSLRNSPSEAARQFVSSYPALNFRQRMATGNRFLREGNDDEARRVLARAEPPDTAGAIELGYSRAFALAMKARRHLREGSRDEWLATLECAMAEIEHYVPAARTAGHSRLLELYEILDRDLASPAVKPPKGTPRS